MLLFNPTENNVELRYGGQLFIFRPKESKDLPEHIVKHFIKTTNSPLVIQTPMYDKQVEYSNVDYYNMPWKKLVQMASTRGLFTPGTKRVALEKMMEEYDQQTRGTV